METVGMDTSIHTLTWPKDFDMLDVKRFETEARARRYQALGRACRDRKIQALMVAHHGDDQAETVMMRLANNRLRTGLKAMQNVEWIPECEGIYGVHHSGKKQRPDSALNIPFPIEQGGIQILRPLLAMEKSRLIATCEEQNVQWAEDKSNQIQTLTSRNAIRHIYRNHKLPEALSIQSLVDVSLHMQKRIAAHHRYAEDLFDQCLMKLDIQTGSLLVRFPPFSHLLARPIKTESDKNEAKNNAHCLIEKVVALITPNFKSAIGQLAARVDNIYPEFLAAEEKDDIAATGEGHFRDKFTVYHVWWRQYDKASPFDNHGVSSGDFGSSAPHPKEWLLTRQTLEFGEATKLQLTILPSQTTALSSNSSRSRETYQLFDGRFWIKLHNYTNDTLVLRLFEKADMRHLPTTQSNKVAMRNGTGTIPERFITATFALLKPSDIRFTLPAVFRKDSTTGEETLVGFPTLNVRMDGFGPPEGICDWKVHYKKVDFGRRSASDIVVPGTRNNDVIEQEKSERVWNKSITRLKVRRRQVVGEQTGEAFTGYKRVDMKNAGNTTRHGGKTRQQDTQRAMEGEEIEGLEFLQDESRMQEDDKQEKKNQTNGRRN
jgi:tRNA(Ile)-lysidine synthase